ncbi:isoprenylcysteine carboxyl methyltransferase family protein [Methyloceanibacter sp.]|uniref:isoprenylcysteine carboxyl methyltransferase family protein n=1 Tax=Methyloceanibacter sp. TaxID=1965321 RepID=UPI002D5D6D94|nr:isoprenylcysteine carboxylmethyltransferase family protein [Methyloceanibacter sp.]HZP10142.1 isoprenylcysteine carboxylmethyltransferase family protein [Methyloceanibacter sp.]
MTVLDIIGAPQIAALIVLAQRGLEELYSARNTRALLTQGASEVGREFYPVVAATHLAWIASLFFLIPSGAPVVWPLIAYYLALQVARYWVIASLGRFWTHRIITLPGAPISCNGPYRYLSHPNYAVTIIETFVLPLAFGAVALAVIMTALWWTVLASKIRLEDGALALRRSVDA